MTTCGILSEITAGKHPGRNRTMLKSEGWHCISYYMFVLSLLAQLDSMHIRQKENTGSIVQIPLRFPNSPHKCPTFILLHFTHTKQKRSRERDNTQQNVKQPGTTTCDHSKTLNIVAAKTNWQCLGNKYPIKLLPMTT